LRDEDEGFVLVDMLEKEGDDVATPS